jgi:hypothetical protein
MVDLQTDRLMAWGGSDGLSCFGLKKDSSIDSRSCHDGASHGCHMLRRLLGLVLVIAAHGDQPAASAEGSPESVAAGGISNAQQAELHRLLQATSEAIQELPVGHRSKDSLRLLHGKLESLRAASADAEEHEWDAMVQALLDSTEYGSAQVEALLQARVGAAAPACNADGADGAGATVGRRVQEAEEAVDARSRSEGARARGLLEAWAAAATAAVARGSLARRWDAWKRWMLDRPPPWERDCDCCYAHCPEHLNCLVPGGRSGHSPHAHGHGHGHGWTWLPPHVNAAVAARPHGPLINAAAVACQRRRARRAASSTHDGHVPRGDSLSSHSGLLQSDKLYLACRGDSVGQVLEKQWAERPHTLVGGTLLTVHQQGRTPPIAGRALVPPWCLLGAGRLGNPEGEAGPQGAQRLPSRVLACSRARARRLQSRRLRCL